MKWNDSKVARELQLARNTVAKYKRDGAPAFIGYACAAIAADLKPWPQPQCGLVPNGDCVNAGTEYCDVECPHNAGLVQFDRADGLIDG